MKKHFKLIILIFLFPLSIYCQTIAILDTNTKIVIKPKFFGINSFQKDGQNSTTYFMGGFLFAKITEKINISTSSIYLVEKNNELDN